MRIRRCASLCTQASETSIVPQKSSRSVVGCRPWWAL